MSPPGGSYRSVQCPRAQGGEHGQAGHQPGDLVTDQATVQVAQPAGSGGHRPGCARRPGAPPAPQGAASTGPGEVRTPPADTTGEAGTATWLAVATDPRVPSTAAAWAARSEKPAAAAAACSSMPGVSPSPSPITSSARGGSTMVRGTRRHSPDRSRP